MGQDADALAILRDEAEHQAIVRGRLAGQRGDLHEDLTDVEVLRQDVQQRSEGLSDRAGGHLEEHSTRLSAPTHFCSEFRTHRAGATPPHVTVAALNARRCSDLSCVPALAADWHVACESAAGGVPFAAPSPEERAAGCRGRRG
jgi:hypothetical protein